MDTNDITNYDEWNHCSQLLELKLKELDMKHMQSFKKGDGVWVITRKGKKSGIVQEVKRTTISVKINGLVYSCSPSLVRHIEKPIIKKEM